MGERPLPGTGLGGMAWGLLSLLPRIVTHYLGGGESEGSDVTVPSSVQIR